MKIVVAGGTGFVGEPLVAELVHRGHSAFVLTRRAKALPAGTPLPWDGRSQGAWSETVASADAVVNLAGESIADGRWTDERKQRILASRIEATSAIVEALRRSPSSPHVLVNASATGFYGVRGDEVLDESSRRGEGFLAGVVDRWEAAAREAESIARVVLLRFGVIFAKDGGALPKMVLPFRLGAGGPIGNGRQWMSWIDRVDVIRMIVWALENDAVRGAFNATAPEPVRNRDFARALGRALHRPAIVPTPAFALRIAFGEMANELLIGGQRVVPDRALKDGFRFEAGSLEQSLRNSL
jgi:uncharacterized protein (TIGR01777 family)